MSDQAVLYAALHAKTGAELLNEVVTEKQLRFMVRVPAGPTTTIWLGLVKHLLVATRQNAPWTMDISKHYFLTPEGDLRYGWRLIVQAPDLNSALAAIARSVNEAPVVATQIEEVRLHGSPTRRVGGLMGHVNVGAAAILSR